MIERIPSQIGEANERLHTQYRDELQANSDLSW